MSSDVGVLQAMRAAAVPFLVTLALAPTVAAQNDARSPYGAAVLPFEGRQGTTLERIVTRAIGDRVSLRTARQLRRAVIRSGGNLSTPAGLASVAEATGVSLFVRGETVGPRANRTLQLTAVTASGDTLASTSTEIIQSRAARRRVADTARNLIADAIRALDAVQAAARESAARARQHAARRQRRPNHPPADLPRLAEGFPDEEAQQGLPLVELVVGAGARHRSWNLQPEGPQAPREYSATFVELYARLRTHPWRDEGGALSGLFGEFEFAIAPSLESEDALTGTTLPTGAFHLEGGVGWLFAAVGPLRFGPYLAAGHDAFTFDDNPLLPSASYSYLRPTLVVFVPLLSHFLQLRADGALRVVLDAGELGRQSDVPTPALGFDAGIELGGAFDFGFAYGGRFAFQSFDGSDQRWALTGFLGYRR